MNELTRTVWQRFPLVARSRPACAPLPTRVGALCALARTAEHDADQAAASTVHNQAALLASDLELPDLAREWCRRHASAYLHAGQLNAQAARHALEPVINLARLHIRDGNGDQAFQLLETLTEAVTSRTDTIVDGLVLPTATLTASAEDHQEIRRWLWTVHLADGTRALTSAGRWSEALAHLRRRKGIGRRLLDGRQVEIIAHASTGDPDHALSLIEDAAAGEPSEDAVAKCLALLCGRQAGRAEDNELAATLERYQQLDLTPQQAVFATRLGLSVIDAAGDIEHDGVRQLATDLINQAITWRDGYAARDVLAHDPCSRLLDGGQATQLTAVVSASGLGSRTIEPQLFSDLSAALDRAEAVITRTLTVKHRSPRDAAPSCSHRSSHIAQGSLPACSTEPT